MAAKTKPAKKKAEAPPPQQPKPEERKKFSIAVVMPPARMGRPPTKTEILEANKEQIEKLMEMRPQLEWLADYYGCDAETLSRFIKATWGCTFVELRNKRMLPNRASLYNAIMDEALNKRNTVLLIYASKNILKWQNSPEPDPEQQEDVELEFVDPGDKS